ncbi:MAG: hypothetical protein KGH61_03505 [Candidatus Micrarchaeota archaeon]|nr:hypothetical protein [Candidatus Micrarchaeota archaeon]MDE1847989.1 hypothetical protein [Candidatus Micrarchaeota archaeon]MDE1864693.1 hypothetical protein [Candidatus Micrarchaeota archaeon]
MGDKKLDTLQIILRPYTLDLLKGLKETPERFGNLKKYVKNERTLSLKLSKLQDYGLVEL